MKKSFVAKKKVSDKPVGDYYSTPKSLIWIMEDVIKKEFKDKDILEPCYGEGAISSELKKLGFNVIENDLNKNEIDYLIDSDLHKIKNVITNPPFFLLDDFIETSKKHCEKFMVIGRMNYFTAYGRYEKKLWKNLKKVFIFNRYVDYQTEYREDGLFCVGAMSTGWFLFDMNYEGETTIEVINVQPYAKLGNFKKK